MMNLYVMLILMLWDVNACLTPRGVTETFYHGLTTSARENIDATAGGLFLSLTIREATTLVEKIASNQG
jgi:hypothetical protein